MHSLLASRLYVHTGVHLLVVTGVDTPPPGTHLLYLLVET